MATKTKTKAEESLRVRQNSRHTNGNLRSYSVPSALATPTDLSQEEVAAVTAAVNPLIADTLALYLKSKNFHWHLSGVHFRDFHLLFDEHAEVLIESVATSPL